jgi:class 3 adenylate cyclase
MNTLYAIQAPQQCELLVAFSDLSAFKHCAQDQSEEQLFAARSDTCRHVVKAHFGRVCCGPIGTRDDKRFDVFGHAVNIAALLTSDGLALTPQVFRRLTPQTRRHFKKHTPPISYISVEDRHRKN